MTFPPGFYRTMAIASVLSAATTVLLIFLPRMWPPVSGLEMRMALVEQTAYIWRSWVYLVHPFLAFGAAMAVALRCRHWASGWAVVGLCGFGLWGATEAAQQMLTLNVWDPWRRAWLAGDVELRATMILRASLYDALWDAMYGLLLLGFLFGNLCYAVALARADRLGRVLAAFYALAFLLTLALFLGHFGVAVVPDGLLAWAYPITQPLARVLIGVWLWRHACDEAKSGGPAQVVQGAPCK
jgi:hypothetical protein